MTDMRNLSPNTVIPAHDNGRGTLYVQRLVGRGDNGWYPLAGDAATYRRADIGGCICGPGKGHFIQCPQADPPPTVEVTP